MGNQVQKSLTITKQGYWSVFPELVQLVKTNPHWQQLVQQGKFEDEKAVLSIRCKEIAKIDPVGFPDVFRNDTPTLATLKKYQGQQIAFDTIEACLVAVNEFFGEKSNLSNGQLSMLSSLIFTEYYFLNLADLKLCIKNGLLGKYGKTYGKISPDVIMDWFSIYRNDRLAAAAHQAEQKHSEYRGQPGILEEIDLENVSQQAGKIREALAHMFSQVEQEKHWKERFDSIESWCKATGQDPTEVIGSLVKEWETEFNQGAKQAGIDWEVFSAFKLNKFLMEVNDGPGPVEQIDPTLPKKKIDIS